MQYIHLKEMEESAAVYSDRQKAKIRHGKTGDKRELRWVIFRHGKQEPRRRRVGGVDRGRVLQ